MDAVTTVATLGGGTATGVTGAQITGAGGLSVSVVGVDADDIEDDMFVV